MKTSKLIAAFLIGMITLHYANAQDSIKIYKPVFFSTDLILGIKNQGVYGGAMLRIYRDKSFVAFGVSDFDYVPETLPSDYYPGLNIWGSAESLNSNTLCLIGYGKFIPSSHQTFRILFQADVAFGKYNEAINFKRNDFKGIELFGLFVPNYEYKRVQGFTAGVHLLAKAEICSRFASVGVNLETFLTTKTTAFCAGVSVGFGKLRKRNN